MANESRLGLFKLSVNLINNKFFLNAVPNRLSQNLIKYANMPNKGQVLFNSARTQYQKLLNENPKQRLYIFLRSKHCHSIAAQRVRRTIQITDLYRRLGYDLNAFRAVYQNVLNCVLSRFKINSSLLLGAVAFSWSEGHISDDELDK